MVWWRAVAGRAAPGPTPVESLSMIADRAERLVRIQKRKRPPHAQEQGIDLRAIDEWEAEPATTQGTEATAVLGGPGLGGGASQRGRNRCGQWQSLCGRGAGP